MENEFAPYELAVKLKALGFDEPCFGFYSNGELIYNTFTNNEMQRFRYAAPTFSQAFRLFREKYGLCNFIKFSGDGFCSGWEDLGNNEHGFENFKTYEEAELACLDKLIEIAESKSE
jgi:hypothetical protein